MTKENELKELERNLEEEYGLVDVMNLKSDRWYLYFVGYDELNNSVKIRVRKDNLDRVEILQCNAEEWKVI